MISEEVPAILASRPRAHWLELLRANDVTAIPVLRQTEAFVAPQVDHNELVVALDDPELGRVNQVGVAARFRTTPGCVAVGAPRPGEHTGEVLSEVGYSDAEIAALGGGAGS